ncbi:hypothetical protein FRC17_000784 [Serendipita sp. 399]|nr:hypothetical protein FRC17_000784 [Serendipita sp. 399]
MQASLPNYSPRGAATAFPMPHAVSAGRILEPQPEGGPTYLQTPLIKGKVPAALSSYSPGNDVENIYKACHGAGTDNELLIKVLVKLGSHEIQVLQVAYKQKRQKDLVTLVDKETSGNYGTGIILLASGALQGDAYLLRQAPAESQDNMLAIFTELAVGRTKHDLATLREYVSAAYSMNLDDTILEALPKNNVLLRQAFRKCLLKGISTRGYDVTRDVNTLKAFFDSRSGENLGEV